MDTRTPAEIAYDSLKDGSAYAKPDAGPFGTDVTDEMIAALEAIERRYEEEECPDCTDDESCPACMAEYEAQRRHAHMRAALAPTARERARILLAAIEMPDGNQIFDLLLEDQVSSYLWYRCIDWVLYRQRQGLPVKRLNDEDDCPAAIDARFAAARDFAKDRNNWNPQADINLLCKGQTIENWERTPAEEQALREETEALIRIFERLETAPLGGA